MFYYKVGSSSLGSAQGTPPLHIDSRGPPLESLTNPCVFEGPPLWESSAGADVLDTDLTILWKSYNIHQTLIKLW